MQSAALGIYDRYKKTGLVLVFLCQRWNQVPVFCCRSRCCL